MTPKADPSGSLALSSRPRSATRVLPKPVDNHRALSAARVLADSVQPAEIAQARVFESLLQAECTELEQLARRIGRSGDRLPNFDSSERPQDLAQIRARLDELHGLLRALQGRFPHSAPGLDR